MSVKKYANATVVEASTDQKHWAELHGQRTGKGISRFAAEAPDSTRYLLSHCTIMSSVMTEEGMGRDHLIRPECAHLVNNNQDAWTNEVLFLAYPTFRGAFNFVEHYQNSKASKGHIIDAVLRKVGITGDIWVYYCDILVATDLRHTQLVADIRSGKIKYMSMGCVTDVVICSYCGAVGNGSDPQCFHVERQKGQFIPDDDGIPRRVAELCGHKSLPGGGVEFVEASWVGRPAFPGAVNRGVIADKVALDPHTNTAKVATKGISKAASETKNELSNPTSEDQHRAHAELRSLFR